jgi:hypothetical protein
MPKRLEAFVDQMVDELQKDALEPTYSASAAAREVIDRMTWQLVSILAHEVGYPFKVADWMDEQVADFQADTHIFDGID